MGDISLIKTQNDFKDLSKYSEEEQIRINQTVEAINIRDSQGIIVYGVGAQREISDFSDNILKQVRAKDSGYVGEVLTDLVLKVKDLKVDSLSSGSGISNIPIIGGLFDAVKKFIAKYDKMSVQIEKIISELDKARMELLKDIVMLDGLYEQNAKYTKNLELFIAAGQIKLKELNEKILPEYKSKAEQTQDPKDAQEYRDLEQSISRFDKKIHDLMLSRIIAIQTAPQVRLIQNNNQALVEKIQSSILNTIPLWKNQIVIAISLFKQRKSLELQKSVTKTTNDLLEKNSQMLKQGSLDIARENERGIVEIETLRKVNSDLITTIEETLKIQEEGKQRRREVELELTKLENDLKTTLINSKK